jgi:DNA polymerase-3 subunit delta
MDSLAFLERAARHPLQPVYAVYGDEDFLKRQVLDTLRRAVLGDDGDFGLSTIAGDRATFAEVHDELHTAPFLGARRLVVVEGADPFVTQHRAALEKYVAAPAPRGVLVLEVNAWPSNTRLAKLLGEDGSIVCKAPQNNRLPEWCVTRAAAPYQKDLASAAARLLVDLVGAEMGQLDQELAKLATYVGEGRRIDEADVDCLVGNSRAANTWKILDAVAEGRPGPGLALLDRLLDQGEEPLRLLGALSFQLRRLAQAGRLAQLGRPLAVALEEAGIPPFGRRAAEQQLRQLGRRRANQLYHWLLELDLGLKGSTYLPPRTQLERLVIRLARK